MYLYNQVYSSMSSMFIYGRNCNKQDRNIERGTWRPQLHENITVLGKTSFIGSNLRLSDGKVEARINLLPTLNTCTVLTYLITIYRQNSADLHSEWVGTGSMLCNRKYCTCPGLFVLQMLHQVLHKISVGTTPKLRFRYSSTFSQSYSLLNYHCACTYT